MYVTFVGPTIEENLAIGHLVAACLAVGHQADAISFVQDADYAEVAHRIAARAPDVVGLSMTFQSRAEGFLALARALRTEGYTGHVTAGGHFAALATDELLGDGSPLDSILCGEADETCVELLRVLELGEALESVPGLVMRLDEAWIRGPKPTKPADLDALPFPARSNSPRVELGLRVEPMVASRGCRGHCTYCSITTFGRLSRGAARRERSPENVVAEMAQLVETRGTRVFVFHDDDFFSGDPDHDLQRLHRMRDAMARARLPELVFSVKARPDDVHAELFETAYEMGLRQVVLGIDNDAPQALASFGRWTGEGAQRRALSLLHGLDVAVGSNLLLWEPGTVMEHLHINLDLMRAFPSQLFNLARTEAYEGAPMTLKLAREGKLQGHLFRRDYVMDDADAERSWRLFRAVLGRRCQQNNGVMQRAIRVDWHRRLLEFSAACSPDKNRALAEQVSRCTTKVASSTREHLWALVNWVEKTAPERDVEFIRERGARIQAEDAALTRELSVVQGRLLHAVSNEARPVSSQAHRPMKQSTTTLRSFAIAGALVASCMCAGCSAAAAAEPGTHKVQVDLVDEIQVQFLEEDWDTPDCGGCSRPMKGAGMLRSTEILVVLPKGWALSSIKPEEGEFEIRAQSQNQSRVKGLLDLTKLWESKKKLNSTKIDVVVTMKRKKKTVEKTVRLYLGSAGDMGCEESPCSDPPGSEPYGRGSEVAGAFMAHSQDGVIVVGNVEKSSEVWPETVSLEFGVVGDGILEGPEIACDYGEFTTQGEISPPAGLLKTWRAEYSTHSSADDPEIKAGMHTCVITFKNEAGKKHTGKIRFEVDESGVLEFVMGGKVTAPIESEVIRVQPIGRPRLSPN